MLGNAWTTCSSIKYIWNDQLCGEICLQRLHPKIRTKEWKMDFRLFRMMEVRIFRSFNDQQQIYMNSQLYYPCHMHQHTAKKNLQRFGRSHQRDMYDYIEDARISSLLRAIL